MWLLSRDLRQALSLGINRNQPSQMLWLGVGTPGSPAPAEDTAYGPEWRKRWSVLEVKQANQLLDKIGLTSRDSDGYCLRTDGKGQLRLELLSPAAAFIPFIRLLARNRALT